MQYLVFMFTDSNLSKYKLTNSTATQLMNIVEMI